MKTITLGRTGLKVSRNAFGALPIQRTAQDEAVRIFKRAFDGGVNFYDTARMYTDSEAKIGAAFSGLRGQRAGCEQQGAQRQRAAQAS